MSLTLMQPVCTIELWRIAQIWYQCAKSGHLYRFIKAIAEWLPFPRPGFPNYRTSDSGRPRRRRTRTEPAREVRGEFSVPPPSQQWQKTIVPNNSIYENRGRGSSQKGKIDNQ